MSVDNMNSLLSAKYKQSPNEIEKNSLNSEVSKERFKFLKLKEIREEEVRPEKFNTKIYKKTKIKVKISARSGRRSPSACFTTKENFTRVLLITSLTFTSQRHF